MSAEFSERDSPLSEGLFVFFSFSFPSISIRNASLCLDEIFEETFLNTVFFFLRNFQRNWAEICRTLTTTLQPTVKNAFYQSRTNFLWRFFYLESYKQLDNLFRKLSILFVQFKSKNTYYFWKVSTWLSKLDCKNLDGFFWSTVFFGWILVFKAFSRHSAMFFEL